MTSIGGRIAFPLIGAYHASKFGLEGVSDTLRRELRGQGIEVIVIEPGGVKTPIWRRERQWPTRCRPRCRPRRSGSTDD